MLLKQLLVRKEASMLMDKNELKKLAQKYLDGKATTQEKATLNQWYDSIHDGEPEEVYTRIPESEAQVKARILKRLHENTTHHKNKPAPDFTIKHILATVSAAAAVLILLFWFEQRPVAQYQPDHKKLVSVPAHKIILLNLADGSKVWLKAGSVFKYPRKFGTTQRTVELLEGHAFFEIKHQNNQPFVVKTKTLNVTVLGTSFDVRAYQNEATTKVSVVTGKVGITLKSVASQPAIMLLPKQQVVLSKVTNQVFKAITPEIAVNAWCKSKLVFEQEDLGNVFKVLEEKYNTRIRVANSSLLNERISITLSNQHIDTIMQILSFTKHFNYKIANDSTIVIK